MAKACGTQEPATPEAIHHHYDVSNRFNRMGALPVDDLPVAVLPAIRRLTEDAQYNKIPGWCFEKLAVKPAG